MDGKSEMMENLKKIYGNIKGLNDGICEGNFEGINAGRIDGWEMGIYNGKSEGNFQ